MVRRLLFHSFLKTTYKPPTSATNASLSLYSFVFRGDGDGGRRRRRKAGGVPRDAGGEHGRRGERGGDGAVRGLSYAVASTLGPQGSGESSRTRSRVRRFLSFGQESVELNSRTPLFFPSLS
jgi:hypothetical protein